MGAGFAGDAVRFPRMDDVKIPGMAYGENIFAGRFARGRAERG